MSAPAKVWNARRRLPAPEPLLEPGAPAPNLPGRAEARLGGLESGDALVDGEPSAAGPAEAGTPAPGEPQALADPAASPDSASQVPQDLVQGQTPELTGGFDQDILL